MIYEFKKHQSVLEVTRNICPVDGISNISEEGN